MTVTRNEVEAFLRDAREAVTAEMASASPGDDIDPLLLVMKETEPHAMFPLKGEWMVAGENAKDFVANHVFRDIARKARARALLWVSAAWQVVLTDEQREVIRDAGLGPGDLKEKRQLRELGLPTTDDRAVRQEIIQMTFIAPGWEAYDHGVIKRTDGAPPTVEWAPENQRIVADRQVMGGRFPNGMRAALRIKSEEGL